jgi:gluconolactonase
MRHRVLADGLQFPEGPVRLGAERIAFVQIRGQCVSLYDKGEVRRLAATGGGPNGATLGPDGALYVANNGGVSLGHEGVWLAPEPLDGRLQRVTLDGDVSDVASDLPGKPPNRPNDLCFGPDGLLYYTDPHNWEDLANLGTGRVARTTLSGRIDLLAEVPAFPNGIGFGADDRLYVAQSVAQKILVMDARPGATPAEHATLPWATPTASASTRRAGSTVPPASATPSSSSSPTAASARSSRWAEGPSRRTAASAMACSTSLFPARASWWRWMRR